MQLQINDKTKKFLNVFLSVITISMIVFIGIVTIQLLNIYFPNLKYLILQSFFLLLILIFIYFWFKLLKKNPAKTLIFTILFIVVIFSSYIFYMYKQYPEYCTRKYFWTKQDCPSGCSLQIVGFTGESNGLHAEIAECLPIDK
ncbi:MAG TPA: hypothetical protein P5230_00970 [Candidatus Magasanikbacteria bacterium]|nr:hypothetical protein [Candidatus Magasanikbacteria bacterium]